MIFLTDIVIIDKKGGLSMEKNENEVKVRVLIACEDRGKNNADMFSEIYNKMFEVEYNKEISDFETAMEYAKVGNMSHILYFIDEINLRLSSLLDDMGGYTVEVTIDDLKNVLSQNANDSL